MNCSPTMNLNLVVNCADIMFDNLPWIIGDTANVMGGYDISLENLSWKCKCLQSTSNVGLPHVPVNEYLSGTPNAMTCMFGGAVVKVNTSTSTMVAALEISSTKRVCAARFQ